MDNLHAPSRPAPEAIPADEGRVGPERVMLEGKEVPLPTDIPIEHWEAIHGHPYTANYFKVENWDELNGITDIDSLRDKVFLIEEYYQMLRQGRSLKDSREAYSKVMSEIGEMLGIEDEEEPASKISRIANFIIASQKAKHLERKKE